MYEVGENERMRALRRGYRDKQENRMYEVGENERMRALRRGYRDK